MPSEIKDRNGDTIKPGDGVWTPIRGGKHEGKVHTIVQTEAEDSPKVRHARFSSIVLSYS